MARLTKLNRQKILDQNEGFTVIRHLIPEIVVMTVNIW